ncbi:MAG TPA: FAD/NAD(P)-binding protein [Acidimicrobiales bacterium]|nr:FAD/NAD(P)-binding protein [Acidimicrobiales bacterium]
MVDSHRETAETVSLSLAPLEEPLPLAAPGQFNMLWSFGVGEVPISVSGLPTRPDGPVVHTIRAVGAVTEALCGAARGQVVGVRGPYGTSWGVEGALGRDVVVVAGGVGLAALRAAVAALVANQDRYNRVVVLVGARSPAELLFAEEVGGWETGPRMEVAVTVDRADPGWRGEVGVVTRLATQARFDPSNAVALVCGPEVMMRFVARALLDRGLEAQNILVSVERNMKCALGHCGHCQLGAVFVCVDGPVFTWDRLVPLLEVKER